MILSTLQWLAFLRVFVISDGEPEASLERNHQVYNSPDKSLYDAVELSTVNNFPRRLCVHISIL